jgi:hypothetical protein
MITSPISSLSNSYSPIFISAFKTPKDYALGNNLTLYDGDVEKEIINLIDRQQAYSTINIFS